jgi:glutamate dehydrogenase
MGALSHASQKQIRCYFVAKCEFVNPTPSEEEMRDLRVCGDKTFLEKVTENTLDIYQSIVEAVLERSGTTPCGDSDTGPVIEMFELEGTRERRLVIGYRQLTSTSFFSSLSDLYHFYGLTSSRKYVEQFSNGITVISIYLLPARNLAKFPPIENSIHQVGAAHARLT